MRNGGGEGGGGDNGVAAPRGRRIATASEHEKDRMQRMRAIETARGAIVGGRRMLGSCSPRGLIAPGM